MKNRLRSFVCTAALVLASLTAVAPAHADEFPIGVLASYPGLASVFIDLTSADLESLNLPIGAYDPADPFHDAAPVQYVNLARFVTPPLSSLLVFSEIAPTGVVGPTTIAYGAGAFGIGIDSGAAAIPWLIGSFSEAFLTFAPDLSTALLYNLGGTVYSGFGFDFSGLLNPGSFAFQLGNPALFRDQAGAPVALGYEITNGVVSAKVPEPSSMLLLGTGVAALAGYRKRRRRAA